MRHPPTRATACALLVLLVGCSSVPSGPTGAFEGRAGEPASPQRLRWHVSVLADRLSPRDHLHPANLDRAIDYLSREFAAAGAVVAEQRYEHGGRIFRNVSAMFGPPTAPRIVVGAHLDAVPGSPGADDDASGLAGLVELAYLVGSSVTAPDRALELVVYGVEEPPFFGTDAMGSRRHAASLAAGANRVALAIALDQIGFFTRSPGSQRFPSAELEALAGSDAGDFIAVVGRQADGDLAARFGEAMQRATNLPVRATTHPDAVSFGLDVSDAASYTRLGMPALLVTDTAPFRGDHRHTAHDRTEAIDYAGLRAVVRSLASAIVGF